MLSELLATKLHLPASRLEHVERPRLTEHLNHALTHKLTLISSPAGYGKTTLISGWLHGLDQPYAWLTLDEQDNDPSRFLAYLVAAFQGIDDRIGQSIKIIFQSTQTPPIEPVITVLLNDISKSPSHFLIVLDDYHLVQAPACHRAIESLLKYAPNQLHLVILTRHKPPLSLPRLRVDGQLLEIGAEDLRFTEEETTQFLKTWMDLELSVDNLVLLHKRTEGWVAGLQLAALSMQGRDESAVKQFIAIFSGSHRHVIDYLTDEVMAQQSRELREFMYQTAFLDRFSGPLCDKVTGRDDSSTVLKLLEQKNLFLEPLDEERSWYRYHHLFASYLRTELNEKQRQTVHLRAAQWFEEAGYRNKAVQHLLASGDIASAAKLIERVGYEEFQQGGLVTLSNWLDRLPEETILISIPLLAYRALTSFILTQSTEAERYLQVLEKMTPPDAPAAVRGRLLGMEAWVASRHGDLDEAIRLGEKAASLLAAGDSFAHSFVLVTVGQAHEARGETLAAAESYRQASMLAKQSKEPFAVMLALVNLALSLDSLGRRREGLALCEQTLARADEDHTQSLPLAHIMYLPLGIFYYRASDLVQSSRLLRKGIDACTYYGLGSTVLVGRYYLGRVLLAAGKAEAALVLLEERSPQTAALEQEHYFEGLNSSLRALIALEQRDLVKAASWTATINPLETSAAPYWFDQAILTFIRILLFQQRYDKAQRQLEDLEHRLSRGQRWGMMIPMYLLWAVMQHARGRLDETDTLLEKAIGFAATEGYTQPFIEEGASILERLQTVRHTAPSFVDKVLLEGRLAKIRTSYQTVNDLLTPRELEVLQLIALDLSNQEIAEHLVVAHSTVKKHINRIFSKLEAKDRTQAVLKARELNLL